MAARGGVDAAHSGAIDGWRFWWRGDDSAGSALAKAMLAAVGDPSRALKRGRRKSLYALEHAGRVFLVKGNDYPGGWRAWLRRSKARREWERTAAATERGVETPLPVAIGELRSATGRLRRCLLAVERLEGARDLSAYWAEARPRWREQRHVATALGELAAAMHGAGVLQRDFAPNNVLAVPEGAGLRLVPIDFERVDLVDSLASRDAAEALAKFYRYAYDASQGLWWRALLGYCAGDRQAARALARRVAAELPAMFRRDLDHLRRTAGRDNRRFRELPSGTGWAHRSVDDASLREALGASGSKSWWCTGVSVTDRDGALECWATALALGQRRGLIARPVAMVGPSWVAASASDHATGWTLVSARRPDDRRWDGAVDDTRRLVVDRRVTRLGLAHPHPRDLVVCGDAPGARLVAPPGYATG